MDNITKAIDYCNLHFMAKTAIARGDYDLAQRAIVQMAYLLIDDMVTSDKVIDGILADISAESEG